MQRELLAKQYLSKRLSTWQQRLQLEGWKVSIVMSHRSDLRAGTLGNIHWDADTKTAKIRVLDATDYPRPFQSALSDMEFTMVHELLHLELAALPKNDDSRGDEEAAVNRMATALLQLAPVRRYFLPIIVKFLLVRRPDDRHELRF